MIGKLLKKFFGDKKLKEYKKYLPIVEEINEIYPKLESLSDEELRRKVLQIKDEIKSYLADLQKEYDEIVASYHQSANESEKDKFSNKIDVLENKIKLQTQTILDEKLPEVFAIIKDTCRRLVGYEYDVRGNTEKWFMIPFDVQLIGGIALHEGKIAEMATGEGKTLVATLPLFLNALVGKGAHLITVNDYLAQRDAEWMRPIFEFHGLEVGIITNGMMPHERKAEYSCDVTYGTNSEFGFDYLRDNMATSKEQLAQKNLFYAIVDEVDSVLIDEARTPLIISGAVKESKNFFKQLKPGIHEIVANQKRLTQKYVNEIRDELKKEEFDEELVGTNLLLLKRGTPRSKALMKFMEDNELKKLVEKYEGYYIRDKKLHEIDNTLFYAIDEKQNSVDLSDKGREILSRKDEDLFVVTQLDDMIAEIDNSDLSLEEKAIKKEEATNKFMDKSEKLHNISQLLKSYSLFEKDKDYVVIDNKVMIVDEFTGRLMPGRRFSDGLHQALEAKEDVAIAQASQTLATITIQNYFRMYDKLAGMTGTAVTEENEFIEIYDLPVMVIPTNVPISRIDHDDLIFKTRKAKYKAIVDEIKYWHERNKPVLVGTVTVEVSELLSGILRRNKIKHNVLNAKNHESEAEIVKFAGEPGSVTIATNMAGRGTDIKLGKTVVNQEKSKYLELPKTIDEEFPYGHPLDGLHVIGTERHESRRIDRQLRGRAGRQGDPGTSRFYLSLEDDLMRLFGSDRIASMLTKLGVDDEDAITHPWMTSTVEKAQKKVEAHNFETRKQLIKYDEVMNSQREIIYRYRRNVLEGYDLKLEIQEMVRELVTNKVDEFFANVEFHENWDFEGMIFWFKANMNIVMKKSDFDDCKTLDEVDEKLHKIVMQHYEAKEEDISSEEMRELERYALLQVVDEEWRDHLHEMDLLKEGISFRAYAQKDPLIEYKKESLKLFETLIYRIQENVAKKVFTTYIIRNGRIPDALKNIQVNHADASAFDAPSGNQQPKQPKPQKLQPRQVAPKVSPNAPCPCGSGKKYKKCCGRKG